MALDATRATMRELAEEWLCDASNATFIVDRLEERTTAILPPPRQDGLPTARGNRLARVLERFFTPPPLLPLS